MTGALSLSLFLKKIKGCRTKVFKRSRAVIGDGINVPVLQLAQVQSLRWTGKMVLENPSSVVVDFC